LEPSLYLVPLRLCTLGVEWLFTSARRNLGDTRSDVPGDVVAFRNTRRMPLEPSVYLFSFRLCTLGGGVSVKFRKNRKNRKKSTIRIDAGGRETYFGPVNIFVKKYMKIDENISGDLEFFWNFRKFFYH